MKIFQSSILLLHVLLLSSCATVYVSEYSKAPGFNIADQRSKSTTVTGFEPVIVKEFVKTFSKRFTKNQEFSTEYANKFNNKLKSSTIFATVMYDPAVEWRLTRSGSFASSELKAIDSLFSSCKTDYLITVTDFEVSNRITTTHSGGAGPNNMGTTTSTEYCVIDARFTVFEVKSRKKMLEFTSRGEQSVFLFSYENALLKAMDNSIEHAMAYLTTGKKEF
ncbi:MAG TPA: hypothetical protein VGK39_09365 [Cyclobacteriaceae bacterium]